jgi:hypothetical protein
MNDPLAEVRAAAAIAPVEGWRVRAVDALKKPDSSETAAADFALLTEGINARPAGRKLAKEFIAELSDSRLAGAYEAGKVDRSNAIVSAHSRLALAEAVLARKGLDANHAAAHFERGCMLLVLDADVDVLFAAFEGKGSFIGKISEESMAALAALRGPRTP